MYLCLTFDLLQVSSLSLFTESSEKNFTGNLEFPQISILDCALEKICSSVFITSVLCNMVVRSCLVCRQQDNKFINEYKG
jgi:hypothetical protein